MNIKEIVEGMTAPQVAQVIKDNFNEVDKDKANKTDVNASIAKLTETVETNKTETDAKIDSNKEETDGKLSELGSKIGKLQDTDEFLIAPRYGFELINGKYIRGDGAIGDSALFSYTKPFKVEEGEILIVWMQGNGNAGIASVDENGSVLKILRFNSQSNTPTDYPIMVKYEVESGVEYISLCSITTVLEQYPPFVAKGYVVESFIDIKSKSKEIEQNVNDLSSEVNVLSSEVNNLSKTDNTDADFNIADERGNIIVKFKDGYISTKNFDSRNPTLSHTDLDVVIFGDSITWLGGDDCDGLRSGYEHKGWTEYFKNKFKPKTCKSYARSGATWSNTENTKYNVEEYAGSLTDDNVMFNQVNRLEVAINNGTQPMPHLILVAMGTNDAWHKADTSLEMTAETAFSSLNSYITGSDVRTLTNVANSVRYNCEKLMQLCPNAQIVLIAPQQSSSIPQVTMRKCCEIIEDCAGWLGISCVRLDKIGGTYYAREKTSYYKTYDGTHTSVIGATENGNLIANVVSNLLKY